MKLIAHRGFADDEPENTLRAIRRAADRADMVEIDVRRCGSGELVVIHDDTVDRVTDGTGAVSQYTLPELRALSVLDSGESVPTLTAVLAALPSDVGIVVDLKEAVVEDALEQLSTIDNEVVVSSFEQDHLRTAREVDPDVPLALIWPGNGDRGDPVEEATELDCRAIHPEWSLTDLDLVERAHDAGLDVNPWAVKRASTAEDLRSLGVDGVIADKADVLRELDGDEPRLTSGEEP